MSGKRIHSLNKGKAGEREVAKIFSAAGFPARRGQQYAGGQNSSDIIIEGLPGLHPEVKRLRRSVVYNWLRQALRDAPQKRPLALHRADHEEWVAVLYLKDFLELINAHKSRNHVPSVGIAKGLPSVQKVEIT